MDIAEETVKPSSEKQRRYIYNLSKEKHLDEEQLRTFCSSNHKHPLKQPNDRPSAVLLCKQLP